MTDYMNVIEDDDKLMLQNGRVKNMSVIDWGKTMAISNQYIHKALLQNCLGPEFKVYSTDDDDFPTDLDIKNNSPGFDLVIRLPNGTYKTIQSKLRQVDGLTDTSRQTHFETTRRNSKKNKDKNQTGHIAYSSDEFDMVLVSLVNVRVSKDNRNDCNKWTFVLVNVSDILNKSKTCCDTKISANVLGKNIINFRDKSTIVSRLFI